MKMQALEAGHWTEEDLTVAKDWAGLVRALIEGVTSRSQLLERQQEENLEVLKQQLVNLRQEVAVSQEAQEKSQQDAADAE